jgi:DNA-binding XRE family transcriptional regulator
MKMLITTALHKWSKDMHAEMTVQPLENNRALINLEIPADMAARTAEAISHLLIFGGQEVRWLDEEGEPLLSVEEVIPEMCPAMVLRGFRGKNEMTQAEFAGRIGITQHHVSEMENGKRSITIEMAKRIGRAFNVSHKLFL